MTIARSLGVAFLWLCLSLAQYAQAKDLPDFADLVEKLGPTVVNISTTHVRERRAASPLPDPDEDDPFYDFFRRFGPRSPAPGPREFESRSLGSGFIVSTDGYILTNAHVVESADEITVRLTDQREFKAKLIGADRRTDVALLKIEANGLAAVRFGDPNRLRVGEWVLAIGSPFGFENSVTAGIVSAKGRSLPEENLVPFIQTDVPINPGNSGGPLFNMQGEVIGINSQIYSRTGGYMGLSFAIPIDVAMKVKDDLIKYGKVSRGKIGVVIQEVSKELAESFGLPKPLGALVSSVEKDSPAQKAGIESGDIILKFNGKPVDSSLDLPRLVSSTPPGSKAVIELWRAGAAKEVTVTVAEMPQERLANRSGRRERGPERAATNRLGFAVSDLTPEQKRDLKLNGGVLVEDVLSNRRADVRIGDVITAVTSKGHTVEIRSAAQFNQWLAQLDPGAAIALHVRRGDNTLFVSVKGKHAPG